MKKGEHKVTTDVTVAPPEGKLARKANPGTLAKFDGPVPIAYIARTVGGKEALLDMARLAADNRVQLMLTFWDNMPDTERERTTIEDLCTMAEIRPGDFLGSVVAGQYLYGADVGKLIAMQHTPEVIRKTAEFAKQEPGHRDRKLFLHGVGFGGTKTGQTINVFGSGPPAAGDQEIRPKVAGAPLIEDTLAGIDVQFEPIGDHEDAASS